MTDGLLRVTKYSLRTLWRSGLGLTGILVLAPFAFASISRVVFGRFSDSLYHSSETHLLFLGGSWFLLLAWCLLELHQSQRMVPRIPVNSAGIASGLMLSMVGLIAVSYLMTNGLYRLMYLDANWFREHWPVMGPTLFLMTLVVVMHSAYWNLQSISFTRLLFWISLGLGMVYWLLTRYFPQGLNGPLFPWIHVTFSELCTMLLVNVVAWIVAVRSFASSRYGAAVPSRMWERVKAGLDSLKHRTLIKENADLSSAASAASRLHWQDSCRTIVLIIAWSGCILFLFNLAGFLMIANRGDTAPAPFRNPVTGIAGLISMEASIAALCVVLGSSLRTAHKYEMKGFLATIPLTDRELAAALVRNILKCVSLSFVSIIVLGQAGSYFASVLLQGGEAIRAWWQWAVLYESKSDWFFYAALILLAYWSVVANFVSAFWSPSSGLLLSSLLIVPVSLFALIFSFLAFPEFVDILVLFYVGLIWTITILAYVQAYRTDLIRRQTLWLAALFCLVVPTLYWSFWDSIQVLFRLLRCSLLILAVTPFATIPLVVSWNRHR